MTIKNLTIAVLTTVLALFLGLNAYHYPVRFFFLISLILFPVFIGIVIGSKIERKRLIKALDRISLDRETYQNVRDEIDR